MKTPRRAGFSLLEVMVALGILVTTLTILVQSSADSVQMTAEAETVILGTDLAESVLQDALLRLEYDGFQTGDIGEEGDFSQHGDATIQAEFGETLEEFHWEYWISEINMDMAGDLAGAAQEIDKSTLYEGGDADVAGGGGPSPLEGLGALGFSGEMLSAMLGPYIREVRVRVWWGKDGELAEERGDEVVITTHVVNPMGAMSLQQGIPQ